MIRSRLFPLGSLTHDPRFGVVFDIIHHTMKVTCEPTVHLLQGWLSTVPALMKIRLDWHALLLQSLVNSNAMFRLHIPIVESVSHQSSGL